jgi:DNA-binding MarR family transcriptional regulator
MNSVVFKIMTSELSKLQNNIIGILCKAQKPLKMGEIASTLRRSPRVVTNNVNILEAKGFVSVNTSDDETGRPKYVELTLTGKNQCKEVIQS